MRLIIPSIILTIAASQAFAQEPVKWSATPSVKTVSPGRTLSIKVSARIDDGWIIYAATQGPGGPVPTLLSLPAGQPFTRAGDVESDDPAVKFDQNFGMQVEYHKESVGFVLPVAVAPGTPAGKNVVKVNARYQACNRTICLPAQTEKLAVSVTLAPSAAAAKTAKPKTR